MIANALVICLLLVLPLAAQSAPVELGRVSWSRELALGSSEKPVLLLFQEVPG